MLCFIYLFVCLFIYLFIFNLVKAAVKKRNVSVKIINCELTVKLCNKQTKAKTLFKTVCGRL